MPTKKVIALEYNKPLLYNELSSFNVKELKAKCKLLKIERYNNCKKAQLIKLIETKQEEAKQKEAKQEETKQKETKQEETKQKEAKQEEAIIKSQHQTKKWRLKQPWYIDGKKMNVKNIK